MMLLSTGWLIAILLSAGAVLMLNVLPMLGLIILKIIEMN